MALDYELARTLRGLGRGGGASPLLEGEVVSTAPLTVSVYNGEVMAPPAPIAVLPGASGYEVRDHQLVSRPWEAGNRAVCGWMGQTLVVLGRWEG